MSIILYKGTNANIDELADRFFEDILTDHIANLGGWENNSWEEMYDLFSDAITYVIVREQRDGNISGRSAIILGHKLNGLFYDFLKEER